MLWRKAKENFAVVILAVTIIALIILVATKTTIIGDVLVAGLVGVTAWYAYSTIKISKAAEKQAKASIQAVEEMRNTRYDAVRPVIDIERQGGDAIREGLAAGSKEYSYGLSCILHNIGLGPAIDVVSYIQLPTGERRRWEFGTRAVGDSTNEERLSLNKEAGRTALVAYYKDVYGRTFESSREVGVDKEKSWELGPLRIRSVEEVTQND